MAWEDVPGSQWEDVPETKRGLPTNLPGPVGAAVDFASTIQKVAQSGAGDAWANLKGAYDAVRHLPTTVGNTGKLLNAFTGGVADPDMAAALASNPQAQKAYQEAQDANVKSGAPIRDALAASLKENFGSWQAAHNTIATHPVSALLNILPFVPGAPKAALEAASAVGKAPLAVAKPVANLALANTYDPMKVARGIVGTALERDNLTPEQWLAQHGQFPQGAPPVVAGGPNTRGALIGSIAPPGPARDTVARSFDAFAKEADTRVGSAISKNVSDLPPTDMRLATMRGERSANASPLFEASGVPNDPAHFPNAPVLQGADVTNLIAQSRDIQDAIKSARRLPQYQKLNPLSMPLLDKAYKHLGSMEGMAIRASDGERARDLGFLRRALGSAIDKENPAYGKALAAYSEPSELIDAATAGRKAFSGNATPEATGLAFKGLKADAKAEFLGGVADNLRTRAGATDRASPGERFWNNGNMRKRLQAVLSPEDYAAFSATMDKEVEASKIVRDLPRGSRTVPMGLDAAENARQALGIMGKAVTGNLKGAGIDIANTLMGRMAEGRTAKVNDLVARMLTTEPGLLQPPPKRPYMGLLD